MPQTYKIIVEAFNNKGKDLIIENIGTHDASRYYDSLRSLSESYDFHVNLTKNDIVVSMDNYNKESMVNGVNAFLENYNKDEAVSKAIMLESGEDPQKSEDTQKDETSEEIIDPPEEKEDNSVFKSKCSNIISVINSGKLSPENQGKVIDKLSELYEKSPKWKEHIDKYNIPNNKVRIKTYVIKPIIQNLKISDVDENYESINKIIEAFNKMPTLIADDHAVVQQFGFPTINFGSRIVREMTNQSNNDNLKVLLKAFIDEIRPTDIADALIGKLSLKSKVLARIKALKTMKGIPVTHKNILITDIENLKSNNSIDCFPLDDRSTHIEESVSTDKAPINEGVKEIVNTITGGKDKSADIQMTQEQPTSLKYNYIKQFYEIVNPLKNADVYKRYNQPNDGTCLILKPRSTPKEGARITSKPLLKGKYFVKSCIKQGGQINNAIGYFITEDEKNTLFTIG